MYNFLAKRLLICLFLFYLKLISFFSLSAQAEAADILKTDNDYAASLKNGGML
jgi:hypothetical protein